MYQKQIESILHSTGTELKSELDKIGATEIPQDITSALSAQPKDGMSSESEDDERKSAESKAKTGPRQSSEKRANDSSSESSSEHDDDDDDDDE